MINMLKTIMKKVKKLQTWVDNKGTEMRSNQAKDLKY